MLWQYPNHKNLYPKPQPWHKPIPYFYMEWWGPRVPTHQPRGIPIFMVEGEDSSCGGWATDKSSYIVQGINMHWLAGTWNSHIITIYCTSCSWWIPGPQVLKSPSPQVPESVPLSRGVPENTPWPNLDRQFRSLGYGLWFLRKAIGIPVVSRPIGGPKIGEPVVYWWPHISRETRPIHDVQSLL